MPLLSLLPGILLPATLGWLVLDALEGRSRVLRTWEKWVYGFLFGMTLMTFVAFLGNTWLGVPFTLWGFLLSHAAVMVPLCAWWWLRRGRPAATRGTGNARTSRTWMIALWVMGGWIALQAAALAFLLVTMPSFFDDTMDNWNLRGKAFFVDKTLTLQFAWNAEIPGVSSYPPSVPLSKTWIATIAGQWSEPLVNGLHAVWYAAAVLIVFSALRRALTREWSAFGALLLAGLPLYLMQGMNAYSDVFLSAHIAAAAGCLFIAHSERTHGGVLCFLRIAALAIALLPFTKNEGWALYFPVLLLLWICSLLWLWRNRTIGVRDAAVTAVIGLGMMVAVAAPWIGFKVINGLSFGNAKGIDTDFAWHAGVLLSVAVNTFFEANWIFLFPLLIGLLLARWKSLRRPPILLLLLAFAIPYGAQMFAYLFTGLAEEALFQTGYARGIIHLAPVIVLLTTVLLHDLIEDILPSCPPTPPSSDTSRT